jgi:hypothetical protein
MTIALDLIEYNARRIQNRHQEYQVQLRALLAIYLDRADSTTSAARTRAYASARELRVRYADIIAPSEGGILSEASQSILEMAEADTGMTLSKPAGVSIGNYTAELVDSANLKLRDSLRLDEDTLTSTIRGIFLSTGIQTAAGVKPASALNKSKYGAVANMSFRRVDRANKLWSSDIYSRTVARAVLVSTYVETYLMTLISNGIDTAIVQGDNGPITFSITGNDPDLPSLDDVREAYFHPNASRLVSKA